MYTDIFTCNGNATLFQMFAPGGTPHSHNEGAIVSDEAGWPTWNGGICKCYAGVFCCAADALVDLIGLSASSWGAFGSVQSGDGQSGNASFVYQALDGACSCNGILDTMNKRDGHGASLGIGRNIRPSDSSGILNRISEKHRRRDVIAKAEAERERGESTPALIRRVNHSPTWNKYAENGVKFWNEFNRRSPDQPDRVLCNFDATYDLDESKSRLTPPATVFRSFLNGLEIPAGETYYNQLAYWPKGGTECLNADFFNLYSPKEKVIIAAANNRRANPKRPPAPDYWSTIAWFLWRRACITATPGTDDFSNLDYIFQRNVDNDYTGTIFDEIFKQTKNYQVGQKVYLNPVDTSTDTNGFWALLGSPTGSGLSSDHQMVMGLYTYLLIIRLLFMERASYRLGSTRIPLGQGRTTSALKHICGLS